jgi:hypothetical protein
MLPRVAFEYGQFLCASSTKLWATSRATPGRLTVNHAPRDELPSVDWNDLGLPGIDAQGSGFAAKCDQCQAWWHCRRHQTNTTSSPLYSLAFLYETPGVVLKAFEAVTANNNILSTAFPTGKSVDGRCGTRRQCAPVYAQAHSANVPEPFKSEPTGGGGR